MIECLHGQQSFAELKQALLCNAMQMTACFSFSSYTFLGKRDSAPEPRGHEHVCRALLVEGHHARFQPFAQTGRLLRNRKVRTSRIPQHYIRTSALVPGPMVEAMDALHFNSQAILHRKWEAPRFVQDWQSSFRKHPYTNFW